MRYKPYIDEVMKFRKALNLTSIANPELFYKRFISPSIAMTTWLPDSGVMLDVGSGMGVPGIPLLLAKPGLHGVLVERRKKRAEFLRHLVRKLGLDADVYDADVNAIPFLGVDVCVARAVTDEEGLLKMFSRHVHPGALAVLPVPVSHPVATTISGWILQAEEDIEIASDAVVTQRIRCYLNQGEVSRET